MSQRLDDTSQDTRDNFSRSRDPIRAITVARNTRRLLRSHDVRLTNLCRAHVIQFIKNEQLIDDTIDFADSMHVPGDSRAFIALSMQEHDKIC